MTPLFREHKSLSELQEDEQYTKQEVANWRQKILLKQLKEQSGEKKWFTTEHGVDWGALISWLGKPFRDD
jgi:hypothetical protein